MTVRHVIALLALSTGCTSAAGAEPGGRAAANVIVGITADAPLQDRIARVDVRAEASGVSLRDESHAAVFPIEVALPPLSHGVSLSVTITAWESDGLAPLLTRTATINADGDRTILLPLRFQDECLPPDDEPAVSCHVAGPLTCIAGVCEPPHIPAHALPDYSPEWAAPRSSACGPLNVAEPEVVIGLGDEPFTALGDGELVTPQTGHQGGSHFFFSVRMSGADPETAQTAAMGTIPSTGEVRSAVVSAEPYKTEGDGCHLFAQPFVLPPGDHAGEVMRMEVFVHDLIGNTGHAHVDLELAAPLPL